MHQRNATSAASQATTAHRYGARKPETDLKQGNKSPRSRYCSVIAVSRLVGSSSAEQLVPAGDCFLHFVFSSESSLRRLTLLYSLVFSHLVAAKLFETPAKKKQINKTRLETSQFEAIFSASQQQKDAASCMWKTKQFQAFWGAKNGPFFDLAGVALPSLPKTAKTSR